MNWLNFEINLSVFSMFLILLFTLVISVLLGKTFIQNNVETFDSSSLDNEKTQKEVLKETVKRFQKSFDDLFSFFIDGCGNRVKTIYDGSGSSVKSSCDGSGSNVDYTGCTGCSKKTNSDSSKKETSGIGGGSKEPDTDLTLDDYISAYYNQFWNSDTNMYSDDYILKTEASPSIFPVSYHHHFTNVKNVDDEVSKLNGKLDSVIGLLKTPSSPSAETTKDDSKKSDVSLPAFTPPPASSSTPAPSSSSTPAPSSSTTSSTSTAFTPSSTTASSSFTPSPPAASIPIQPSTVNKLPNSRGLQGNIIGDVPSSSMASFSSLYSSSTTSYTPPSPMNYMNSVPATTSNFIPITADFSKFV